MTLTTDIANFAFNAGGVNTGSFKRNRIINGNMLIDQRNAGAASTPTNGAYTLDRWAAYVSQASKITVQQNAGSVTPPAGYTNYLGITVGASANVTVGTGDYFFIQQTIEGYNIADFGFGAAGASTITFSFWVRSSVTGTFGGCVYNGAGSRSYPFTYTISSSNTWEQKTVTVSGETTGTWNTINGAGLNLDFSIGTGATKSGTAGAWASANYYSATGAAKLIETNSATFYITGVQLETGTKATPYEYVTYSEQLTQCQRYHQGGGSTSASIQAANYKTVWFAPLTVTTGQAIRLLLPMKTSMRSTPTVTYEDNNGNVGKCYFNGTNATVSNYNATSETVIAVATAPGNSSSVDMWINYVLDSEL